MKISIITITYNSGKTVNDTLKSVDTQTYDNIEHIVIDGASKDNTLDIVKAYPKIKLLSEPDNGIYDAMNKGVAMATGDIVGILNSDDILYDNETIADIIDCFNNNNTEAIYGNIDYVSFDLKKTTRTWISKKFNKRLVYSAWQPPHPSFYARREVYQKVGFFDTDFKIASDFDWLFTALFIQKIKTTFLSRKIVKMREGGASNGSLKIRMTLIKEYLNVYKKNKMILIAPIAVPLRILGRVPQFLKFNNNE